MKKQIILLMMFVLGIVSFAANENVIIKQIDVVNNREVPAKTIVNNMSSKVGEVYSTEKMVSDYEKIKSLDFIEDVAIQTSVIDGGIKLTVNVLENRETRQILEGKGIIPLSEVGQVDKSLLINSIVFKGNRHVSTEKLRSLVPIKVGSYFSRNKIIEGHRNLVESGMFMEVIPEAFGEGRGVRIVYNVKENPVLNGIVFYGNTMFTDEELMREMKTQVGKMFDINTVRSDRDNVLGKYHKAGYALAEVADMGINSNLELEVYLNEGIVRDIQWKKMVVKQKGERRKPSDDQLKTHDYVIEREIEIKKGQVFNSNDYDETVNNLMRLGHFKNIKYEANPIPGDNEGKSIVLLVDEERTAMLQGAISYGSEVGFMGSLSLKDSNWKGRGQDIGVSYERSSENYSNFSINFYDPWIRGTNRISWGWSAYFNQYEDDDSRLFNKIDTVGAKLTLGKGLSKNTRLSITAKGEYVREKARKSKFTKSNGDYYWDSTGVNKVEGIDDKYFLWSLAPAITYDTRNHPWNTTKGFYAKLQLEGGSASGYKGGTFGNATLELRTYHRGLFKKNTFAYRVVTGVMTEDTKETQRFWVGGGNSLRGYDGGFFRGTKKVTASIENRTQLNDVIGLVAFFDAGRAWDNKGRDMDYGRDRDFPHQWGTTAGVGLRLNTPVGPLRFDFGWPVGKRLDSGMEFYFNMGHSF
ncbi:BamA/OMP85 family outer membrane protein [Fusobacterium sp. PH5-44]|uniref:BamA/OMP85 family outer membrane protein n=1 Tax=unclassified Fusobacterium TaxID=2648384 RepID=UPI003D1E5407